MNRHSPFCEFVTEHPGSGKRVSVWDVRRLRRLAAGLEVKQVEVESLHDLGEVGWFGASTEAGRLTVREVAEHAMRIFEADMDAPILLSAESQVLDGLHRLARAHLEGRKTILARQFTFTPKPDWLEEVPEWYAATANLKMQGGSPESRRRLADKAPEETVEMGQGLKADLKRDFTHA